MPSLRASDGYVAAKALLLDIAQDPVGDGECRVQVLLKLVKNPVVLATMVSSAFDVVGDLPDIYGMVDFHNGQRFAEEYASALYRVNLMRRGQGRDELPIVFRNEDGTADNIVDFASYKRRRELAA